MEQEIPITQEEQTYNWLKIGMSQASERISEWFYYDKRDHEFFSILVADYFLLDKNMELAKNTTSNYSEVILKLLFDRIRRIESEDQSIIPLPRSNKNESIADNYIEQKIATFLNINAIDAKTATVWDIDTDSTVLISLKDDQSETRKKIKPWWKFWKI